MIERYEALELLVEQTLGIQVKIDRQFPVKDDLKGKASLPRFSERRIRLSVVLEHALRPMENIGE